MTRSLNDNNFNICLDINLISFSPITAQAQVRLSESSKKLDLLRYSLDIRRHELPPDSPAAQQLKHELQNVQASSPVPVAYTSLQPFRVGMEGKPYHSISSLGRCAAVTGKLEVRLMGCQALLEEVPGRSRRDKDNNSSPGDLRSFVKGVTSKWLDLCPLSLYGINRFPFLRSQLIKKL